MRQRNLFIQHPHIEAAASDLAEYEVRFFVCLGLVGGIQELQIRVFLRKQDLCKFADHRLPFRVNIVHPEFFHGKLIFLFTQALEQARRPGGASSNDYYFVFFHSQAPLRSAFTLKA